MAAPVISVEDQGDVRHVQVLRKSPGNFPNQFTTSWPADLLSALADLKGEWFSDSYARFEDPYYIQRQVDIVLAIYGLELTGKRILDFGCGFGASSYCLMRRGADRIVAADLEPANTALARRIFERLSLAGRVEIREENLVPRLQSDEFDMIWLQAVLEHLLPRERREYLPAFWKALRPGGYLIITETPNRAWPHESHTTGGRYWLNWRSPRSAFTRLRRESAYQDWSDEQLYRSGVIGATYSEILDCLQNPPDCDEVALRVKAYLPTVYQHSRIRSGKRELAVRALGLAEPFVRRVLRRPITAFLPYLQHLAFRKHG
jgi:2-polyprenyl-3-methyl-5-hydroxy-6-metoxy-1,4-benzoquinol methylase